MWGGASAVSSPARCTNVRIVAPREEVICRSHWRASGQMTATQLPRPPSPGRLDTPVLGKAAGHRSPTAPSPSSLASSFAWARRSQATGARSSRGRIARSGYDPRALRLELNWKLRYGAGGRCHALGPPRGRCRALLRPPRGRVFLLRRSGPPDVGQVFMVPGSCGQPAHALPLSLQGLRRYPEEKVG